MITTLFTDASFYRETHKSGYGYCLNGKVFGGGTFFTSKSTLAEAYAIELSIEDLINNGHITSTTGKIVCYTDCSSVIDAYTMYRSASIQTFNYDHTMILHEIFDAISMLLMSVGSELELRKVVAHSKKITKNRTLNNHVDNIARHFMRGYDHGKLLEELNNG